MVPISALHGDNVAFPPTTRRSTAGPTLLEYLEEVDIQADRDLDRLRLPIQWVGRPPTAIAAVCRADRRRDARGRETRWS